MKLLPNCPKEGGFSFFSASTTLAAAAPKRLAGLLPNDVFNEELEVCGIAGVRLENGVFWLDPIFAPKSPLGLAVDSAETPESSPILLDVIAEKGEEFEFKEESFPKLPNKLPVPLVFLLNWPKGLAEVLDVVLVDENIANPPDVLVKGFVVTVLFVFDALAPTDEVDDSAPILKLFTPKVDLPNEEPNEAEVPKGVEDVEAEATGLAGVFEVAFAVGKAEAKPLKPKEPAAFVGPLAVFC